MQSKKSLRDFSLLIALVVICAFFAIVSPQFLSARNLSLLTTELSITATLAMGMLLVILPGNIDLSAGSGVGLLGGIASVLVFEHKWPAPLAMGIAFAIGILLWFCMGNLVVRQKMPAFIITLGGLLIFKGLFWLVIHNSTIPIVQGGRANLYSVLTTFYLPLIAGYALAALIVVALIVGKLRARKARQAYGFAVEDGEVVFLKLFLAAQLIFLFVVVTNKFRGIPFSAVILGVTAFAVYVLTTHTPFGRYLYAIAGFMQTSYSGASTTTVGDLMELDAIAACVIGGVSLKGGQGTVPGVLFGALIMACLLNGMTLLAVSPEFKFIARGAVLSLAVWMDVRLRRKLL